MLNKTLSTYMVNLMKNNKTETPQSVYIVPELDISFVPRYIPS